MIDIRIEKDHIEKIHVQGTLDDLIPELGSIVAAVLLLIEPAIDKLKDKEETLIFIEDSLLEMLKSAVAGGLYGVNDCETAGDLINKRKTEK